MTTEPMRDDTREKLKAVSTATLTTVLFKRGFRNCYIQGIHLINADAPRMVGPAYTLRYIQPARTSTISACSRPHAPAAQRRRGTPAWRGLRHRQPQELRRGFGGRHPADLSDKRGCAGIVTDGGFRDTPRSRRCRSRPTMRIPQRRRTSSATTRPTSTCPWPAATSPCIRATSWSATARASR